MNWSIAAVVVLCLANFFLHKPISDVCDAILARVGFRSYDRGALFILGTLCLLAIAPIVARRRPILTDPIIFGVLMILAAVTVAAQQWLLVTNIELVHLPQFGLLAALLNVGGLGAPAAWLGATIAGIVDETYQYLVIYAGRSDVYFDYNDMILNAIGAAWAAILLGAGTGLLRSAVPMTRKWRWLAAGLLLALPVAFWVDPPQWSPFFHIAATRRSYRVLSLPEGLLIAIGLGVLVMIAAARRPTAKVD